MQRKLNKGEKILTTEVWQEMPYGQKPVRQESQGRHGKCQLPVLGDATKNMQANNALLICSGKKDNRSRKVKVKVTLHK